MKLIRGLHHGCVRHNKCQTHSDYVMYDRQPGYRWAGTHRLITGSVARRNNAKEFNLGRLIARDTGKVTWPRLRDQKWMISATSYVRFFFNLQLISSMNR